MRIRAAISSYFDTGTSFIDVQVVAMLVLRDVWLFWIGCELDI